MFTGIIEEIGKVKKIAGNKNVLVLETRFPDLRTGESIAVNGVCLTVSRTEKDLASFNLSLETMEKTGLGKLRIGQPVNLERALRLGDRIGGHLVTGHIDGKGKILAIKKVDGGLFSSFANENLKEGDMMDVMEPVGKFYTDLNPSNKKNYLA